MPRAERGSIWFAQLKPMALCASLALAGCTKGAPVFSALDFNRIPKPLFAGQTNLQVVVNSPRKPVLIAGQCDPKIQAITANAVDGTLAGPLASLSQDTPQVSCTESGQFSFTLKSLQALGYYANAGTTYTVELRGVTTSGVSGPSTIQFLYDPSTGAHVPVGHLAAGSATRIYNASGTPTNYQLAATVRISANAKTIKSSTTVLQMGRAAE